MQKSSYHFIKGTNLVCQHKDDEIRLHIAFGGTQTVFVNGVEVGKLKSMKLKKMQKFDYNNLNYSIQSFPINGQVSATDYEFRKNDILIKVIRTRNDFNFKKMSILFVGIFLISIPVLIFKLPDYLFWVFNVSYLMLYILLFANSFIKIEVFDNDISNLEKI